MATLNGILSEDTKNKLKEEVAHIFGAVLAVLLGEVSNSLDGFSKDISAKISSKANEAE